MAGMKKAKRIEDDTNIIYRNQQMAKGKNVLTTGDVAKICHVAPRTVSKWFDNGQLKGYRIPGSKDRRIPVSELMRFMKVHNMPTAGISVGKLRVLIADSNENAAMTLAESLKNKAEYDVQIVRSNFETGAIIEKFAPHVLIISLLSNGIDAADVCKWIRSNEESQTIKIVALVNSLSDSEAAALMQKGYDGYISYSDNVIDVIRRIEEVTAIIY